MRRAPVVAILLVIAAIAAVSRAQEPVPPPSPGPDAGPSPAAGGEKAERSVCPFCRTEQDAGNFFCVRCGRLFRMKNLGPQDRFWGDAFYVLEFPPAAERPSLTSDLAEKGLAHEAASFYSGERYALDVEGKKGIVVTGKVMGWGTSKEVSYHATVADTYDGENRLTLRELHGVVKADPARHIYRRIEYGYEGNRLSRIEVGTWLYRGIGDWEKRPSEWSRHERAEIHLIYAGDVLSRIDATRREGRKGLRGNLEYTDLPSFSDIVQVEADGVVSLKPGAP